MEIQQLYYYMELCKQKNFTEAGYACNMTQGALSKQIRKLENELGITLIQEDLSCPKKERSFCLMQRK